MNKLHALTKQAVQIAGGNQAVADRIGTTRQAVYEWAAVPAKHVLVLEEMSGVSRYELRPDIYGPPPNPSQRPLTGAAA